MKTALIIVLFLTWTDAFTQTRIIIVGDVKDLNTNEPLAYATIGVKNFLGQAVSNADGKFELSLPADTHRDTLVVTYVGYEKFEKAIPTLASTEHVRLKEVATILEEVKIVHRQLDVRVFDNALKPIRDKLYACEVEVTNFDINNFLAWLEDYNKFDERKRYDFNLDRYSKSQQDFYKRYQTPSPEKSTRKNYLENFNNYPAVNVSYETAVAYCKWLTDQYNESPKKKKFKKVLFRLPTLNEWQIAALGYKKFQSWNLLENMVEVIIPKDTTNVVKGEHKTIKVEDRVWYPWFWVYHYRDKVVNTKGCYLGNFRIDPIDGRPCPANSPAFDGFAMMSPTTSYFPNGFGLFDVVGNIAEMIDEEGKACGGSWNDIPEESTIHSVKNYSSPDETVGFRVFMEVIEK